VDYADEGHTGTQADFLEWLKGTNESIVTVALNYSAGEGGSILGEVAQIIKSGTNGTLVVAVADSGYRFVDWCDGVTVPTRQDLNITADLTVTANFELIPTFILTYTAGAGGTIEGTTPQTIQEGKNGTGVTAIPNSNYVFLDWTDGVTTATRTDINIASNLTVTANFEFTTYTLTYTAGAGGTIEGTTPQTIVKDEDGTTVTAIPLNGFRFIKWTDGTTTATRTDIKVTADIAVTASFELIPTFTVIYLADIGGTIGGFSHQTIRGGENGLQAFAVPNQNYRFVRWCDGLTTAQRIDNNITENLTFTAYFENYVDFAGGNGTLEAPFKIANATHLANMELHPTANYILQSNINLNDISNFAPLFSEQTPFNGVLNGGNFAINNLTIVSNGFHAGLFAVIGASARVFDLNILNASVTAPNFAGILAGLSMGEIENVETSGILTHVDLNAFTINFGGIVGRLENNITNSRSNVQITIADGRGTANVGGLVGLLANISEANITLSSATGDIAVTSTTVAIGGLIGRAETRLNITNSYNAGNINATDNGSSFAGGFVGYNDNGITITNSYNTGNINATNSRGSSLVGGFVGVGRNATITNSYNTGNISATSGGQSSSFAGGFVGYNNWMINITNSYNTGEINATNISVDSSFAGGFVGFAVSGSISITNSYNTGDINATSVTDYYFSYGGGFVGSANSSSISITNSYNTGKINSTNSGEGSSFAGGFVGRGSMGTISNAHWLTHADGDAEYAFGLESDRGIPTSLGTTSHTTIEAMFDLADTLNAGGSAWIAVENGLPILAWQLETEEDNG